MLLVSGYIHPTLSPIQIKFKITLIIKNRDQSEQQEIILFYSTFLNIVW